jgi:hypothetical protein
MRPGGARHRHGLSRPPRVAGGAARGLRRVARRQQGRQHRARRPPVRHRGRRLPPRGRRGPGRSLPLHRLLELQPFPGGRGCLQDQGLAQRSGDRAAHRHPRGIQRGLQRCGLAPGARPRLPEGWRRPQPDVAPAQPAAGLRLGDVVHSLDQPDAGGAGPGPARGDPGFRRRHPDQPVRWLADAAAGRPCRRAGTAAAADDGAGAGADAHGAEAGARPFGAVRLACAPPADRVLQPAFHRRPHQSHLGQR